MDDFSREAKEIYKKYWSNLPNINYLEDYYGGDTMNSYNTLLGTVKIANGQTVAEIFEEEYPEFTQKLRKFEGIVNSPGNFMPLPTGKTKDKITINMFRSYAPLNDYFDLFLFELNKVLSEDDNCNKKLYELVWIEDEKNKPYFESINYNFEKFCEINFIDINDYFDKNGNLIKLKKYCTSVDSVKSDGNPNERFIEIANEYIDRYTPIIKKREERIFHTK